jgi:hypothetical protein
MGRGETYTGFWWGNLREHLGDPDLDGRIMLRRIFRKLDVGVWTGWSWLRIGTGAGTCECGNEPSCSISRKTLLCGAFHKIAVDTTSFPAGKCNDDWWIMNWKESGMEWF